MFILNGGKMVQTEKVMSFEAMLVMFLVICGLLTCYMAGYHQARAAYWGNYTTHLSFDICPSYCCKECIELGECMEVENQNVQT